MNETVADREPLRSLRVELDHATVLFTTRIGGVSTVPYDSLNLGPYVGDEPESVAQNLELLRADIGDIKLRTARQTHGSTICDIGELADDRTPEADGLVSGRKGEGLMVTVADCLPVALATPTRIAMLHCGWRPLAAGIIERALTLLGGEPVQAVIGPGICSEHFEVGPEVPAAFGAASKPHYRGRKLDLTGIVCDKLAGVMRIEVVPGCTFGEPGLYFSHRRDGDLTGRQAGVVWRT